MTFYAVRPRRPDFDADVDDEEVVLTPHCDGWTHLDQAIAFWRLVDPERAEVIEQLRVDADLRDPDGHLRFTTHEVALLADRLEGIETALLAAGILNSDWQVAPERVEELGQAVPGQDLRPNRPMSEKVYAFVETLGNVWGLRTFLRSAAEQGCEVVHS